MAKLGRCALAACVLGSLLGFGWSNDGFAQAPDPYDAAREAYTSALHASAQVRGGIGQPAYFAIVRRGLDQFDAAVKRGGVAQAAAQIDIATLDAAPAAVDNDPRAQLMTSVRLGIRPDTQFRIVNGWPVGKGLFDEVVALTGNGKLCSGIALDGSTVLTAAHCACDLRLAVSDPAHDPEKQVFVGTSIGADSKKFPVDLGATKFLSRDLHGLDPCPNILLNIKAGNPDVALVRVGGGPMNVPAVRIATPQMTNAALGGDTFYIYGFGCTLPIQPTGQFRGCNSDSLGVKMTGFVTFSANCTDPNACAPGGREFALRDIGSSAPIDTCGGDSGGPVIIIGSQTDALVYHLVGITSRPFNPNGNCGDGGIYGKVGTDEVINWLKTHVVVQN